ADVPLPDVPPGPTRAAGDPMPPAVPPPRLAALPAEPEVPPDEPPPDDPPAWASAPLVLSASTSRRERTDAGPRIALVMTGLIVAMLPGQCASSARVPRWRPSPLTGAAP